MTERANRRTLIGTVVSDGMDKTVVVRVERLVRDAHGIQFHPLQEKRQQHFTGRMALGLDPIEIPEERKLAQAAE